MAKDDSDDRASRLKALRRSVSARSAPRQVKTLVTLALYEAFWSALERGTLLPPHEIVVAAAKRFPDREQPEGGSRQIDPRQLSLQLLAIQHAYCTAARIYVNYIRDLNPRTKTATKGRPRNIDEDRATLLNVQLTHLGKARLLDLPTKTPEERQRAKDVVRKRIALLKKRRPE